MTFALEGGGRANAIQAAKLFVAQKAEQGEKVGPFAMIGQLVNIAIKVMGGKSDVIKDQLNENREAFVTTKNIFGASKLQFSDEAYRQLRDAKMNLQHSLNFCEQRIGIINRNINKYPEQLESFRSRLEALDARLKPFEQTGSTEHHELSSKRYELWNTYRGLSQDSDYHQARIGALQQSVGQLQQKCEEGKQVLVQGNMEELQTQRESIRDLEEKVGNRSWEVQQDCSSIERGIEELEQKLKTYEDKAEVQNAVSLYAHSPQEEDDWENNFTPLVPFVSDEVNAVPPYGDQGFVMPENSFDEFGMPHGQFFFDPSFSPNEIFNPNEIAQQAHVDNSMPDIQGTESPDEQNYDQQTFDVAESAQPVYDSEIPSWQSTTSDNANTFEGFIPLDPYDFSS
ncbi:MAG: hypothetical protein LW808_002045 [Verrucomicrobiota bacterium]|nr:MAG: hypothetical protein LW808_002045 [Verrucomicrobiota bacterium]